MQTLERCFSEAEWYLGEERMRNQQLKNELQEKDRYIQKIEEDFKKLKQQYDEAHWYLGEEKDKREQFESALKYSRARSRDLESQLDQIKRQFQTAQNEFEDAQWFLGKTRSEFGVGNGFEGIRGIGMEVRNIT
jgi:chromosome segregation ATPase